MGGVRKTERNVVIGVKGCENRERERRTGKGTEKERMTVKGRERAVGEK